MILEELWFLCSKNVPDSGTGAQETRHLNGEEERTNTEWVENGGGNTQDNDTNVEQPEDVEIGATDPRQDDGRLMVHFKTCVGNNLQRLAKSISAWPSFYASLKVNSTIILVSIAVASIAAGLLYLDFELTDKCLSMTQFHGNIPLAVLRWEFLGDSIQAVFVNLWFVVTMMLLFGESLKQELKHKLISVGLVVALVQIVVKAYLIMLNAHDRSCNEVFLLGFCYSSYLVGKAVNNGRASTITLNLKIAVRIGAHFLLMFVIALCHRFVLIPFFNREKDLTLKSLIALISPVLAFVATSISQYLVLVCSTPLLVERNRMYVLVYSNQLLPLALFRVMQADFDNWGFFVGLSYIYSITNFFSEVTREHRKRYWRALMECLGNARPLLFDKPESEILQIHLQIQYFLYHYAMIILSQIYITLYRYSRFDVPLEEEMSRMVGRIAVGLVIELFLNIPSVLLQIVRGSKIRDAWFTHRKRHVVANVVVVIITLYYFSQVLFSVLQVPMDGALAGYRVRNCSLPFRYE